MILGWVDTKDSLPKYNRRVNLVVSFGEGNQITCGYRTSTDAHGENWLVFYSGGGRAAINENVSYWRPMPDGP